MTIRHALVTLLALGCSSYGTEPSPPGDSGAPVVYTSGATALVNVGMRDLLGDGHRDLIAVDHDDGSVRVLTAHATGAFDAVVSFPTDIDAVQATSADVNGDGIPDLLVLGHLVNAFYVRLGLGNGQFAPAVAYHLRNHGNRFIVADFNGDGFDDVVVSHDGSGQPIYITAFTGSASGTLQPVWEAATVYFTTEGIATGDFDGDGKKDVAIAIADARAAVLVLRGVGTGAFETPVALAPLDPETHVSDGTTSLAVGDLNGDGRDEIVTSCFALSNRLGIRLSTAAGFADPIPLALPAPVAVALGDLDGDGKLDAIAANLEQQGTVSLLRGSSDGTFQPSTEIAIGPNPASIAVGDFDGNGFADVAVASISDGAFRVLLNPRTRRNSPRSE